MTFNINDKVRVKLTPMGAQFIRVPTLEIAYVKEWQVFEEQFWYLMVLLADGGFEWGMGQGPVFVDNEIEVVK